MFSMAIAVEIRESDARRVGMRYACYGLKGYYN